MRFAGNSFVLICFLILLTPDRSNAFSHEQHRKDTSLDLAGKSSLAIALQPFASATLDEVNLTESRFPVVRGERIELINIAQEIGKNRRKDFGFALLGTRKRKIIEEITREDSSTANKVIILEWLLGKGKTPVTSRVLVDALHEIGMNELADEITLTCEALNILDLVYMPTSIKEYSQKLSKRYQSESIMNTTQWLPRMFKGRNISIEFVDLTLKENGNTITLSDIINDMQSGMRILFLGRPGVGKTTLTRHLSRVWTKTDSDQFYLVVKVHLGVAGKIDNLDNLINASIQRVEDIEVISEYISATQGKGVCILLDGFDEYVYDSTDYVSNLIHGYSLSEAVVILTSRPALAEIIESSFPRKIEIIGFGDSGIKMYLDQLKLSQDENQTITEYFRNHPSIKQLCYLPLHLSMLVYIAVVKADPNIFSLVKTETELYSSFLTQTITQYQNVRQELRAKSFMKCFDNRYNDNDSCFLFWTICEHAFNGVMSREQKFDSSSFDDLPESECDENLTNLKHLELGVINKHDDDTPIPDNLFDGLKGLEQLETLTLCISWNKDIVDVNTMALIGGLKSLSSLNTLSLHFRMYNGLRKNGGTELLHGLKMLSISELNLFLDLCWNNGIGDITVKELSTVLKKLSNLLVRKLSLCIDFNLGGIVGLSGPRDLIEGLRGLTKLQHLHLELSWELRESDNVDEACIAFAEGLKFISKLKVLELDFTQSGSINCQIKTLLESLNQVEELSFKWRSSKDKTDVTDLFDGLKHLKKLRKFLGIQLMTMMSCH